MSFEQRWIGWGRLSALAMGLSLLATTGEAAAFTAPRGAATTSGRELASGGTTRAQRSIAWQAPAAAKRAYGALAKRIGAREAMWDRDTGVPLRVWGAGLPAPDSVQSPAAALRSARALLTDHLAVLAPGARVDDFVLVGDDLSNGVRSLGFEQRHAGRPVIGGQLSFRFKADRLVMIGSEAQPHIHVRLAATPIADAVAQERARGWILQHAGSASAGPVEGPFILPITLAGQKPRHVEVLRVVVHADAPLGKFAVYVDAATGDPVARESLLHHAVGSVQFQVPQRGPVGPRVNLPAPLLGTFVNGVSAATDAAGGLNFADGPNAAVLASVQGVLVGIINEGGAPATKDLSLPPGGVALWADPSELIEAQLSAYIHANVVKSRVRTVAPDFAYLDQQLQITVNINDICNAFSDGDSLNFFLAGAGCENTARIADVVYHEFGHSVHVQGLIPGVGQFEGALSEGTSDYLSATITDDASLALGFFLDDPQEPLRELDPPGDEWRWPDDLTGEVHDDGRIIGGTLWDLRTALVAKLGPGAGVLRSDRLWFESIRRAVDIPTMYPEALLADDDDGDLSNGTPNECEINVAFAQHGLLGAAGVTGVVDAQVGDGGETPVTLTITSGAKACVDLAPVSATLVFKSAGGPETSVPMPLDGSGSFIGLLPAFPDGSLVEYQVIVALSDGSSTSFPQNEADPFYQIYFGPVTPLFCTSFEGDAEAEGWNLGGQWQQGAPQGQGGDPALAFVGGNVLGVNLAGIYAPFSSSTLASPVVPTAGFPTVRLQYRRWLGVEDGSFDQASISVNGELAWANVSSGEGTLAHRDSEWRFHDLDITEFVQNDQVELSFGMVSDGGLEMSGWNLDELCVVGTDQPPPPPPGFCGDAVLNAGELCDNGPNNSDSLPGACRTNCQPAACADLVVDPGEQCDDGNVAAGDGCGATCQFEAPVPTTDTLDVPTESHNGDGGDDGSSSGSETEGAGLEGGLADRGCACDAREPAGLRGLGLAALVLLSLRRRRR